MSACPTCKNAAQTSQVLVIVDGVTYVQVLSHENRVRELQASVNYLLALIEREREKGPRHG